jgi:hypothetical protein
MTTFASDERRASIRADRVFASDVSRNVAIPCSRNVVQTAHRSST